MKQTKQMTLQLDRKVHDSNTCSSKIQIGFTFLVPAHLGSPGQRAVERVCVCVSQLERAVMDILLKYAAKPGNFAQILHSLANK